MRAVGWLIRALSEAEVAKMDLSGLADRVMARVAPRRDVPDRKVAVWSPPRLAVEGLLDQRESRLSRVDSPFLSALRWPSGANKGVYLRREV